MARGAKLRKITLDFDRFAAEAKVTREQFVHEFVNRMSFEVVRATPVLTGFLRASAYLSTTLGGAGKHSAEAEKSESKAPQPQTLARLALESEQIDTETGQLYLLFGANYAIYVESKQHFVRGVAARAIPIARQVIRDIAAIRATGSPTG